MVAQVWRCFERGLSVIGGRAWGSKVGRGGGGELGLVKR
ncbi:unnamed protein product, partial [marine sediment metagenome]